MADHLAGAARYRIDGGILAYARAGVSATPQGADEHDLGITLYTLGAHLTCSGHLAEAREQLEASLVIGERIGDPRVPYSRRR
jgi:hypothetical protein